MKIAIIAMTILILLAACSAKSDVPAENTEQTPVASPADTTGNKPVATTPDTPLTTPDKTPAATQTEPEKTTAVEPLVTFIELGAKTCIPCKMMQPIMKEITDEYQGLVKVVFYDLNDNRQAGQKYGVRVMPTQVFLDAEGKEFFRHEGFYPKADIQKMLAEKAGVTVPKPKR